MSLLNRKRLSLIYINSDSIGQYGNFICEIKPPIQKMFSLIYVISDSIGKYDNFICEIKLPIQKCSVLKSLLSFCSSKGLGNINIGSRLSEKNVTQLTELLLRTKVLSPSLSKISRSVKFSEQFLLSRSRQWGRDSV